MNRVLVIATTVLLTSALNLSGLVNTAQAQVKPMKVKGGGNAPVGLSVQGIDSPFSATGTATHLGKYSGDEGIATVISFAGGTFKGSFVFVAANGDRLPFTFGDVDNGAQSDGTFFPVTAGDKTILVFCAEFNPIVGEATGRFENVIDGSFTMLAMTEPIDLVIDPDGFTPPFNFTWEGEGWIEFEK